MVWGDRYVPMPGENEPHGYQLPSLAQSWPVFCQREIFRYPIITKPRDPLRVGLPRLGDDPQELA